MAAGSTATPARRRPGRAMSQEKHAAMLAAARTEFGAGGYPDTTMDAIALRAQVSKRTLYHHFSTKEEIFRAIVREFIEVIRRSVQIEYSPTLSLREQLEAHARAAISLVREPANVELFRAILAEHIRNPALVQPAASSDWQSEYGFEEWVEAARRDGRLSIKDSRRTAHLFASLLRGLITWPVLLNRVEFKSGRLPPQITEAIDMFLGYCAAKKGKRAGRSSR